MCQRLDLYICSELWNLPAADNSFVKTGIAVNADEGQRRKKGMVRSPACAPGGVGAFSPEGAGCSLPNVPGQCQNQMLILLL